jgi:hypothetical protein
MRFIVLAFLAFILFSLFSALYYVWKDRGTGSHRAVRALTIRVALSILLFALLVLSYHFGFIAHRL